MTPRLSLLGIPPELRFRVIKFVSGNLTKQPQLPCCPEHVTDTHAMEWAEPDDIIGVVPAGARDVLVMATVCKQLHAEVLSTFFPHVRANFCAAYAQHSIAVLQGFDKVYSPYEDTAAKNTRLQVALRNFHTVHYEIDVSDDMRLYDDDEEQICLNHYLRGKLAMMDGHRHFVEALNASPSLKKVKVTCKLLTHEGPKTNIADTLKAFERLRNDIELEIHLPLFDGHEFNKAKISTSNGFPSQVHINYLNMLQNRRDGTDARSSLIDEWMHVQAWLFNSIPNLQRRTMHGITGDIVQLLTRGYVLADAADEHLIRDAVISVWRAHDSGDPPAFLRAKQDLLDIWERVYEARKYVLMADFKAIDEARVLI